MLHRLTAKILDLSPSLYAPPAHPASPCRLRPALCEAQQCRFGQGAEAAAGADVKRVIAVLELGQSQGIQPAFHHGHSSRPRRIPKDIDGLAPAICEARLVLLPSLIFPPLLESLDVTGLQIAMGKVHPSEGADSQLFRKSCQRLARDAAFFRIGALCRDMFRFLPAVPRRSKEAKHITAQRS